MDTSNAQTIDQIVSEAKTASDFQWNQATAAAVASANASSASSVESLGLIHQARTARLTRDVTNLTALHGETSAVVVAVKAAQANAQTIATRVEIVRRQAVASAPTVTAAGWAVWGHVYQAPATPLSGYTVFLVDGQKTYQSQYGFASTAADGSFAIVYNGDSANSASASNAPAGTSKPGAVESPKPTIPTLYLSITNKDAQLVSSGNTAALSLVAGKALYIDITLAADAPVADLPAEVRKTAQPPGKKKA